VSVGDVNQILLSLGGVIQKPGTDFTVSGSTLTFTTAPAANTSFFAILLGSDNGGTTTPTDLSVTTAKIAADAITSAKIADDAVTGDHIASSGAFAIGAAGTSSSIAGLPVYVDSTNGSVYTHDVSGTDDTAQNNTAFGLNAADAITTADSVTVFGKDAGTAVTTGSSTTCFGKQAGKAITEGTNNICIGVVAGQSITTGGSNICIGAEAGDGFDTEDHNMGIGRHALGGASLAGGEYNVAVGNYTLQDLTTGDNNVAVGYNSMNNTTTAPSSTAVGYAALRDQTTGGGSGNGYNIGIGAFGMANVTTGSFNIGIGGFAYASATDSTSQIVMGYNVSGSGDSTFTFGGGSSDTTCSFGATSFSAPSDERWKKDIETSTCGLSFINDLRPVSFKFKTKGELDSSLNDYEKDSTEVAGFTSDSVLGFVAQEVKTVIDNHSEFKGSELWKEGLERHNKRQRISKEALIPIMVKAIQELSEEVKKLKET